MRLPVYAVSCLCALSCLFRSRWSCSLLKTSQMLYSMLSKVASQCKAVYSAGTSIGQYTGRSGAHLCAWRCGCTCSLLFYYFLDAACRLVSWSCFTLLCPVGFFNNFFSFFLVLHGLLVTFRCSSWCWSLPVAAGRCRSLPVAASRCQSLLVTTGGLSWRCRNEGLTGKWLCDPV